MPDLDGGLSFPLPRMSATDSLSEKRFKPCGLLPSTQTWTRTRRRSNQSRLQKTKSRVTMAKRQAREAREMTSRDKERRESHRTAPAKYERLQFEMGLRKDRARQRKADANEEGNGNGRLVPWTTQHKPLAWTLKLERASHHQIWVDVGMPRLSSNYFYPAGTQHSHTITPVQNSNTDYDLMTTKASFVFI